MGTNFYLQFPATNHCEHCGRSDEGEELHICKSSAGWVFSLHVIPERGINDLEDWLPLFDQGAIRDEYGDALTKEEMLSRITERKGARGFHEREFERMGYRGESDFHRSNYSLRGPNNLLRHQVGRHCLKHGEGTWDCIPGKFS